MPKRRVLEGSYRVTRVRCAQLVKRQHDDARWREYEGTVETPHGIVGVRAFLALKDASDETATYLRFVYKGRVYSRVLDGRATTTERSAALAAGKFMRDVVAERIR